MSAFVDGLAQFFVPTHLLAVVAIGLLAGQGATRFPITVLGAYTFGLCVGSVMIAAALRGENTAPVLLAVAALAGIMVAAALPIPARVKLAVAAATGGTIAINSPPQAITIPSAVAIQVGVAVAALATFWLITLIGMQALRPWQSIGVRIIGSWIAASAILALTLWLAR